LTSVLTRRNVIDMNTTRIANIAIPSPRNPSETTTAVAEVIRQRLHTSTSTDVLRARLARA